MAKVFGAGKMPTPQNQKNSCGVGVSPASRVDEEDFCNRSNIKRCEYHPQSEI
ncbi:hypothetical protein [Microseira wollei]|uniref:hypothetical protein n=1 Tax=Microseira wollei TaxID=467598 RepID=UPI001CFF20A1|nr:hypothetical protein [Microseira wollei]